MDRLLRLGGGMPGLNQGAPPSDAPVVDTAEQVNFILENLATFPMFFSITNFVIIGIYKFTCIAKNAETWSCWSTNGSYGSNVRRVC